MRVCGPELRFPGRRGWCRWRVERGNHRDLRDAGVPERYAARAVGAKRGAQFSAPQAAVADGRGHGRARQIRDAWPLLPQSDDVDRLWHRGFHSVDARFAPLFSRRARFPVGHRHGATLHRSAVESVGWVNVSGLSDRHRHHLFINLGSFVFAVVLLSIYEVPDDRRLLRRLHAGDFARRPR